MSPVVIALLLVTSIARAAYDVSWDHHDDDLTRFVTRPEIRSPVFEVAVRRPDLVTPGFWFVGPYAHIVQERHPARYYQACQTGPAIYDSQGQLVWSGACLFSNQNTCDFRVFNANGSTYLSAIMSPSAAMDSIGSGVILDSSMQVTQNVYTPIPLRPFNMHEFLVRDGGRTAMYLIQKTDMADLTHLAIAPGVQSGLVVNMGFREVDLRSNEAIFTWWASDYIDLSEATFPARALRGPYPQGWDWLHLNAVDKNSDGDYLVTARYTDAIYKLSGRDGSILWRLGGTSSSFNLAGFNFSRPHDARFHATDAASKTETITFLDNGGCEESRSSDVSSALIIRLDMSFSDQWTATVQQRWTRPDGGMSDKRGNFQLLPNGNAFVGWSENSYISEHSPDGEVLMEAQFISERMVTYRAYKFNFTSAPSEPPVLRGFAYGESPDRSVGVYYVSWNGATEVTSWEFYNGESDLLLGRSSRTGFETSFQHSSSYVKRVYAKAVSASGDVLGRTAVEDVERPAGWATQSQTRQDEMSAKGKYIERTEL